MNNTVKEAASPSMGGALRQPVWLVPLAYAVLAWAYWGYFVLDRGLHGDTIYVELSQTRPGWAGFLYPHDKTRLFVSLPFHLAYVLSDGSYLSLHLVFGVLVWLTGLLTYRLVKTFLPHAELASFAAGAIAMTHGGDDFALLVSINMVRQAIVCVLLAVLLLRIGWLRRWPILLLPIALAQYVTLWTYEAGLIVLAFAPLLILSKDMSWRRFVGWSAAWTVVPFISVAQILYRYTVLHEVSYQSGELADRVDVREVVTRLGAFVAQGVAYWQWPQHWLGPQAGCEAINFNRFVWPIAVGTAVFAGCAWLAWRVDRRARIDLPWSTWAWLLLGASVFLVLAYAPYLALKPGSVSPTWRTQLYAAPPAAIVIVALAGLVDRLLHARAVGAAFVCTTVVAAGIYAGLSGQLEQTRRWVPYRQVMAAIVAAAPRIKNDTLVTLVGTPPTFYHTLCENAAVPNPPFEDQMWFSSALRVMYPNTRLVGLFWWADRKNPGASPRLTFDEAGATLEKGTDGNDGKPIGYDRMLAFAWDRDKGALLLPSFPAEAIPGAVQAPSYDPMSRILPGPAPVETLRKLAR